MDGSLGEETAEFECDDESVSGVAAVTRYELNRASEWLESLGFRAPAIEQNSAGEYLAWIADEEMGVGTDDEAWGVFSPNGDHGRLALASDYWIISGETTGFGTFLAEEIPRTYSMVHELFHAVQYSYAQGPVWSNDSYSWIWEGSAEAVSLAWFRKNSSAHIRTPVLFLSDPLHQTRNSDADYNAYFFWGLLGRDISSPDMISYLQYVFQENLQPNGGLDGLHEALQLYFRDGLFDAFPAFVALHGDHNGLYDASDSRYTEDAITATSSFVEGVYEGQVNHVAANAYDIYIDSPPGDPVAVTVTLEEQIDDLHMSVNGFRVDSWIRGDKYNVFEDVLPSGERDTLKIRIANIARNPADSVERSYTLTVRLERVDPCSEASLRAAINPYSAEGVAAATNAANVRSLLVTTDDRNVVFNLGQGEYSINGDGGVACVSHFGVSDLEWQSDRDPDFDYESHEEQVIARHMPRAIRETGFTEAEIRAIIEDGTMPAGATPQRIMRLMEIVREAAAEPLDMNQCNSGVFFYIFEPSLIPALGGGIAPENLRSKDGVFTRHGGVAGWSANSASNLIVYMPGVSASEIRDGSMYPAIAYSISGEDTAPPPEGPETSTALYTTWDGEFVTLRCNGEREEEFEGTQTTIWGRLEGTVSIERVTGASIVGSFSLSGSGERETLSYEIKHRTHSSDCPRYQDIEERFDRVTISASGSFTAPNMRAPGTFMIAGVGRAVPVGR